MKRVFLSGALSMTLLTGITACTPELQKPEAKPQQPLEIPDKTYPARMREVIMALRQDPKNKNTFREEFSLGDIEIVFAHEGSPETGRFTWKFRTTLVPDVYVPRNSTFMTGETPFALGITNVNGTGIASLGNPVTQELYGNHNFLIPDNLSSKKGIQLTWNNKSNIQGQTYP